MDEAPQFYGLFTAILIIGVVIILMPGAPLIQISLWTQVINGVLLPVVLICMMLMVNNKEVMGEHVNTGIKNIIGWATIVVLIVLTFILTFEPLFNFIFK